MYARRRHPTRVLDILFEAVGHTACIFKHRYNPMSQTHFLERIHDNVDNVVVNTSSACNAKLATTPSDLGVVLTWRARTKYNERVFWQQG